MNQIYQWSPALFIILKVFLSYLSFFVYHFKYYTANPSCKTVGSYCGFFLYICFLSPFFWIVNSIQCFLFFILILLKGVMKYYVKEKYANDWIRKANGSETQDF